MTNTLARPALSGTAKRFFQGTHRTRPPEETWAAIRPLLGRAGITRVADVTRLDRLGIPVFQAVRPASRNVSVSQGKGATREAARVSAAMEALETWHAERLDHLPQVELPLREMAYENAVAVDELDWLARTRRLDAQPVRWLRAARLASAPAGGGGTAWIPRSMVELDFTSPRLLRPRMFRATSNGLASGNDPAEALVHGLAEVIERHGLALAGDEPERRRPLDLDTLPEPLLSRVEEIRAAGGRLAAYDLTWEAGVPVAEVELALDDHPFAWRGSGAHPSPEVAVSRALTEAAQSRLTYISGARDDVAYGGRSRGGAHRAHAGFREPSGGRPFAALPDLSTPSTEGDLEVLLARLGGLGHRVYWLDLSRRDVGVDVVRVLVPGLRESLHG